MPHLFPIYNVGHNKEPKRTYTGGQIKITFALQDFTTDLQHKHTFSFHVKNVISWNKSTKLYMLSENRYIIAMGTLQS